MDQRDDNLPISAALLGLADVGVTKVKTHLQARGITICVETELSCFNQFIKTLTKYATESCN